MTLESYLRERRRSKQVLLMTHIVIGYPSLERSFELVHAMVEAGVDLMELQVPFSEPIADGPVILRANHQALASGIRVDQCLAFAERVSSRFDIPFLLMTYYNILFKAGIGRLTQTMASIGLQGAIIPDLPFEEATQYLEAMASNRLDPIFIYSPNTSDARMRAIAGHARGFVYCVARKGVTGKKTDVSDQLYRYLARCRSATSLPLAVGFGLKSREQVSLLEGRADIAVVGTESIRVMEEHGVDAVKQLVAELAQN